MPDQPDEARELPKIPGFILEKELGRGGVGVVYLARQIDLNRRVALKMLLSRAHSSAMETQRFYGEAESMASLQHPNLVMVYQIGRHDGLPFLVMEYLDGGTLADRLKARPLAIKEAVELLIQLADAVGYCHDHGIIHRDLKPANILFNQDGVPKVTDFGMAKRLERQGELTTSGTMLGTPNYMAPEQALGVSKMVNAPADVWALGVLLYEAITSRKPFAANVVWEILDKLQRGEFDPPRVHRPDVPAGVERIILHCLQLDPAKRYPTGRQLAEDLRRWMSGQTLAASDLTQLLRAVTNSDNRRFTRPILIGLAALFSLLLVIVLVILIRPSSEPIVVSGPTPPTEQIISPPTILTPQTSAKPTVSPPTSLGPEPIPVLPKKQDPPIVPIEPKRWEVAPQPLLLPSSEVEQAEYARELWWQTIRTRPLSRKFRLLEACRSGFQQARLSRDGQAARHSAWLGVSRVSQHTPDYSGAARELALGLQAREAEREPLLIVLRGILDRQKLRITAQAGEPIDLAEDISNLSRTLSRYREAIQRGVSRPDRIEDTAVATWFATQTALELLEKNLSDPRRQRSLGQEIQQWMDSEFAKQWPTSERVLLQSQLRLHLKDFHNANQAIQEQIPQEIENADLWLLRGQILVLWSEDTPDLERLKDAEKALIQAKNLFDPLEQTQRLLGTYWLGKACQQRHFITLQVNQSLDFDAIYLQAIRHFQEVMMFSREGESVELYELAAREMVMLHMAEARRLARDPIRSKQLLAVIDSLVRRAELRFRDPWRGYFEAKKVDLMRQMGQKPSGSSWYADLQSSVDIGTQPGAITQDRSVQARLRLMQSKAQQNEADYPEAVDRQGAIREATKAALLADTTELMPAALKAELFDWLGQLHYLRVSETGPQAERVQASRLALLHFRKAIELGLEYPGIRLSQGRLATLLPEELTGGKEPTQDLITLARTWQTLRQSLSDDEDDLVPTGEFRQRLEALQADLCEGRTSFRKLLESKLPLTPEWALLAEVSEREMELKGGTAREIEAAIDQVKKTLPGWRKQSATWPDSPTRDQLRAALIRLEKLVK